MDNLLIVPSQGASRAPAIDDGPVASRTRKKRKIEETVATAHETVRHPDRSVANLALTAHIILWAQAQTRENQKLRRENEELILVLTKLEDEKKQMMERQQNLNQRQQNLDQRLERFEERQQEILRMRGDVP